MPTYTYHCLKCEISFDVFHGMSETISECKECKSPVKRVPSGGALYRKNKNFGNQKPGGVVKQHIKDIKEQLREEQKKAVNKEYDLK
jgi:putative FmdB family regulatory protein